MSFGRGGDGREGGGEGEGPHFRRQTRLTSIYISYTLCRSCSTAVIDARRNDRLSPLLLAPEMPGRLLGHLPRAKKFIGGHISPCPFSTCPSDRSPFVERRFQFASRRFFVINLQTAQRRNAKSKREKEEEEEGGGRDPGRHDAWNKRTGK